MNTLTKIRTDEGVTQEQVARFLGLSGKTPYNWEHLDDDKVKPFQRIAYEAAVRELGRKFGCTYGQDPPPDGRYTQLAWVGGSYGNYDSPHVASTEPAAA